MKLIDITNNLDFLIERIEYIFTAFQTEFPDVCYDERSSIVGIGEPNTRLLCYFKSVDGEPLVKFKSNTQPVPLMDEIEHIDLYISETIRLFKTNDLSVIGKKVDELIKELSLTNEERLISDIASKRLTDALNNAGVKTLSDLNDWTYLKLLDVPFFGEFCLWELHRLLLSLQQKRLPETTDEDIKCLYRKSSKRMIDKIAKMDKVKEYLGSIEYDENQFGSGTIGRVLCLREKAHADIKLCFCDNDNELYKSYLENISQLEIILEDTKSLLVNITNQLVRDERNRNIFLSLLGINGEKYTLEDLGRENGLSRERIRQIFVKESTRLSRGMNLYYEDGVKRYILKQNYLKSFESIPLDTFILYLHINGHKFLLKALYEVLIQGISIPDDLEDRVKTVQHLIKKNARAEVTVVEKTDNVIDYKGFQVIISDDGEVLTDLPLLDKLKQERLALAKMWNVPPYCIYLNKSLVLLATFKPLNKEMYISIRGFREKSWNAYGSAIVEIIKEHVNNSTLKNPVLVNDAEEEPCYNNVPTERSLGGKSWSEED